MLLIATKPPVVTCVNVPDTVKAVDIL